MQSGSLAVDYLCGGYREGVVTEISGPPSSGKTTLSLLAARQAVGQGYDVLLILTEPVGDLDKLVNMAVVELSDMGHMQKMVEIWSMPTSPPALIIIDSLSLIPSGENYYYSNSSYPLYEALQYYATSKGLPVIVTAQLRDDFHRGGGRSTSELAARLEFPVRLRLTGNGFIKLLRSPYDKPNTSIRIPIEDRLVRRCEEALIVGEVLGLVERRISWYCFLGELIGQGREEAIRAMTPERIAIVEEGVKNAITKRTLFPTGASCVCLPGG